MVGGISPTSPLWAANTTLGSFLTRGFDVGGYTGNINEKAVAGVVHGGEYVFSKAAVEKIGLPNIGILLDFGHAIMGGESAADSAQLAIDYGRLFGMDVNDNYRSWDDDLVAGSLHPIELFEFFYVLRKNKWEGVWQLDQFPFREDSVATANHAIDFLKAADKGLEALDLEALKEAQSRHDAISALRIAQKALFGAM